MKNNIKKIILIFLITFGLNLNSSVFEKINNSFKKLNNYYYESKDEFLKKFKPFAFPLYIGLTSYGLYKIIKYVKNIFIQKKIENKKFEESKTLDESYKYILNDKHFYEIAIHEIGHLICLLFNKNNPDKLDFITIIPDKKDLTGNLGSVSINFKDDSLLIKKEQWKAIIIFYLGGYAAETIYLNTINNGCSQDLNIVKDEIKNMILTYGMCGLDLINYNENDIKYKEAASKILNECLEEAKKIINSNKGLIEVLLKELLTRKTLYREDIKIICLNYGIDKLIVENF